jgi:hypothetical protein
LESLTHGLGNLISFVVGGIRRPSEPDPFPSKIGVNPHRICAGTIGNPKLIFVYALGLFYAMRDVMWKNSKLSCSTLFLE